MIDEILYESVQFEVGFDAGPRSHVQFILASLRVVVSHLSSSHHCSTCLLER